MRLRREGTGGRPCGLRRTGCGQMTTFTILFGTTTIFRGFCPSSARLHRVQRQRRRLYVSL